MLKKILCISLLGGLALTTGTVFAAPQDNFFCNMSSVSSGLLVAGTNVTAGQGKVGVLVPIPASCTQNNVCAFKYTITHSNDATPLAQNNNADTSFTNGSSISADTGVYYAYFGSSDAAQCIFKGNFFNSNGTLSINTVMSETGQSASYWEGKGVHFN